MVKYININIRKHTHYLLLEVIGNRIYYRKSLSGEEMLSSTNLYFKYTLLHKSKYFQCIDFRNLGYDMINKFQSSYKSKFINRKIFRTDS